jgi:hypothetical protein
MLRYFPGNQQVVVLLSCLFGFFALNIGILVIENAAFKSKMAGLFLPKPAILSQKIYNAGLPVSP